MTEHDAQQVLLVRAIERQPASSTWTDEDRLHASQEALRQTGPEAERSTFVIERARLACERLIARKPALGDLLHSLQWRGWFEGEIATLGNKGLRTVPSKANIRP